VTSLPLINIRNNSQMSKQASLQARRQCRLCVGERDAFTRFKLLIVFYMYILTMIATILWNRAFITQRPSRNGAARQVAEEAGNILNDNNSGLTLCTMPVRSYKCSGVFSVATLCISITFRIQLFCSAVKTLSARYFLRILLQNKHGSSSGVYRFCWRSLSQKTCK